LKRGELVKHSDAILKQTSEEVDERIHCHCDSDCYHISKSKGIFSCLNIYLSTSL